MADDNLLSKDEIDALLHAVSDGDVPASAGSEVESDESAVDYDFSAPGRIIHSFLPTLEMVNERFSRSFRLSLFNILRRYAEFSRGGVQVLTQAEYMHTLPAPISINLVRVKPLRGTALMVFEPQLISSIVDNFFGGSGRSGRSDARDLTPAENRMVRILLDHAFKDLKQAWSSIMSLEFEFLNSETNPQFATVMGASESEVMIVTVFNVDIEGGGGAFHVSVPYSMLEPLRARLTAPIQNFGLQPERAFRQSLTDGLQNANVELNSTLAKTDITMGDLMHLKQGDVIPLDIPASVALTTDGVPLFMGKYGVCNGKRSVKVTRRARKP